MTPRKSTGVSPLQTFGFRCTLTMWLKIISENYCKQLFKVKIDISDSLKSSSDRLTMVDHSLDVDFNSIYSDDVKKILEMMPNERYRRLIELRYVKEKTNEETAMALEMTMDNYYNKHKLAKAQFCNILRKEGLL
jgi:DNA-directed RNA polymerase specialized sigma subunit